MNKQLFRVIFSQTLKRDVVVSELTKAEGKTQARVGRVSVKPSCTTGLVCTLRQTVFSVWCALGVGMVLTSTVADAQPTGAPLIIQADKSAPQHQQAVVLQTANGIPQVNIQTPNEKGLSHNKYQHFSVDTPGAILNNSRTAVQTQLGGWVQGNPYLARGEAKVILNEVTSSNPSTLKGYMEVAGQKAHVIIANPAGLHCEGCGVINADKATFTTGKPQIAQGNLEGFVVQKGRVSVAGKGLDNTRVDYTQIISREVQANAGIWAGKDLTVVTGAHQVNYADKGSRQGLIITHRKASSAANDTSPDAASTPRYAVDVGELGGMYAGQIHLMGTEQGVGVRNAGHMGASSDSLRIDSQGRLVNTGTLNAASTLHIDTHQGIENRGTLENRTQAIRLQTAAQVVQDGRVLARGGEVQVRAGSGITQQGQTMAKGDITYTAPEVQTGQASLMAAGVSMNADGTAQMHTAETPSSPGKRLAVVADGRAHLQGKQLASGVIEVAADHVALNHSEHSAHDIILTAKTGDIEANQAQLIADNALHMQAAQTLSTKNSYLSADHITSQQQGLNNQQGVWVQRGEHELTLNVADTLLNQEGTLFTAGHLRLNAQGIDNRAGRLIAAKQLTIDSANAAMDSTAGQVLAGETLSLTSQALRNVDGVMASGQSQQVMVATTVDNTRGKMHAGEHLTVKTATFNNQQGVMQAQGHLHLKAQEAVDNQRGQIAADKHITLKAALLKNTQTVATAAVPTQGVMGREVQIDVDTLDNQQGGIYSGVQTQLNVSQHLNNREGEILSTGNITVAGAQLVIEQPAGQLQARDTLLIQGKRLNHDGHLEAKHIAIDVQESFSTGQNMHAQESLWLRTQGTLHNQHDLYAGERVALSAAQLNNHATGRISSAQTQLQVSGTLSNEGLINSVRHSMHEGESAHSTTLIHAQRIENKGRGRIYGDRIALQADTLINQDASEDTSDGGQPTSAVIAARARLAIGAREIYNVTQYGLPTQQTGATLLSLGDIEIGRALDTHGRLIGQAQLLRNSSGLIEAQGNITLNAATVENLNAHVKVAHVVSGQAGSDTTKVAEADIAQTYIVPSASALPTYFSNSHGDEKGIIKDSGYISTALLNWVSWSRAGQYVYKGGDTVPPTELKAGDTITPGMYLAQWGGDALRCQPSQLPGVACGAIWGG